MEDVHRFSKVSDGVIVGSKIVKALHQGETEHLSLVSQAVKGLEASFIHHQLDSLDQALCLLI